MSTELMEVGSKALTSVRDTAGDLELVACNVDEMKSAQGQMCVWFAEKKSIEERDLAELEESLKVAVDNGWKSDTLKRQVRNAVKRVEFYEKCRLASEAGFCIIPNLPMDLFAVRTAKNYPTEKTSIQQSDLMLRSEAPAAGAGENVSPDPLIRREVEPAAIDPQTKKQISPSKVWFTSYNFDEVQFPIAIRHPQVMTETAHAMAMKIFDEVGIVANRTGWRPTVDSNNPARRGDPLIVGVIRNPKRCSYDDRKVSFLIAWHVDMASLL